jgi:hypothetical protein
MMIERITFEFYLSAIIYQLFRNIFDELRTGFDQIIIKRGMETEFYELSRHHRFLF